MTDVRMMVKLSTENPDKLHSIISHHIDYLIDFDDNRDIVSSACEAESYCIDDKVDGTKLGMIATLVDDIIGKNEPSDDDLDNDEDAIEIYACLHNLKEALKAFGYSFEND